MASLTGNKIKDTYTSLLKIGDNGTIDSSAQALTDGDGNSAGLFASLQGISPTESTKPIKTCAAIVLEIPKWKANKLSSPF